VSSIDTDEQANSEQVRNGRNLRLVPNPEEKLPCSVPDAEMRSLLADMKRRQRRPGGAEDDAPDAA